MNGLWKGLKAVLALPIILILAWIIAHFMALLGIFAVVAYPIWAALFGKKAVCLGCIRLEDGEVCPLCNEKVEHHETYPKNGRSIILNTFLLLFLTGISVGVVFLENAVIDSTGILSSGKTVSFSIPEKNQYRTNEIFPMKIEISGIKTSINVVQADITFDPDILEVVDLSTKDSFASIFVQKDVNNNLGYIRLTGGIPSPGYAKESGVFGTVYFKAKTAGLANVSFLPTSMVLADDGRGTNVLKSFPSTSYIVKPEVLTAEETFLQDQIFESDILGARSDQQENLDVCRIELGEIKLPDVLGVSNFDDPIVESDDHSKGNFYRYVIHPMIEILHRVDQFIINIYAKITTSIFTR